MPDSNPTGTAEFKMEKSRNVLGGSVSDPVQELLLDPDPELLSPVLDPYPTLT
jgi:hypothetical protein